MNARTGLFWVTIYLVLNIPSGWAHNAAGDTRECEARLYGGRPASWSNQTVVLDTNVLLNDPNVLFKFSGAEIIISGAVLEEIDSKKSDPKLGMAAREFSRILDRLLKDGGGSVEKLKVDSTTSLRFDFADHTAVLGRSTLDVRKADNQILALAIKMSKSSPGRVWVVSDDINVRIKASGHGIPATGSDASLVRVANTEVKNYLELRVTAAELERFRTTGTLPKPSDFSVRPNQFVMLATDSVRGSAETLARYFFDREDPSRSGLRRLRPLPASMAIKPRNMEQAMMLELILDPGVDLLIVDGGAGTGKTTLAMAAGTEMVNQKVYDRILGTRTLVQVGSSDLGAYPGSLNEKLGNYFQNFADAIEGLKAIDKEVRAQATDAERGPRAGTRRERRERRRENEELNRQASRTGTVPFDPLAFNHIRGRNLPRLLMILDETQNASPTEVKTFNTRAGRGSKLILLGDASQIDAKYLNSSNNGLTDAIARYTAGDKLSEEEQSRIGYVRLTQGERAAIVDITVKVYD